MYLVSYMDCDGTVVSAKNKYCQLVALHSHVGTDSTTSPFGSRITGSARIRLLTIVRDFHKCDLIQAVPWSTLAGICQANTAQLSEYPTVWGGIARHPLVNNGQPSQLREYRTIR